MAKPDSSLNDVSIGSYLGSELELDNYLAVYGDESELQWAYASVAHDSQISIDEYVENVFGHVAEAISKHLGTSEYEALHKESFRLASLFAEAWRFEKYEK